MRGLGVVERRFNALKALSALHAGSTDDPLWLNSGVPWADNDPVSTWRNDSGGGDPASTLTNRPLYKKNILNGHSAVLFDHVDDRLVFNITDIAQPFHILTVVSPLDISSNQVIIGRGTGGGAHGLRINSTPTWGHQWATAVAGGVPTIGAHVIRDTANGSLSTLAVDGSSVTAANPGTLGVGQIVLGSGYDGTTFSQPFSGYMFFWGFYNASIVSAALVDNLGILVRNSLRF